MNFSFDDFLFLRLVAFVETEAHDDEPRDGGENDTGVNQGAVIPVLGEEAKAGARVIARVRGWLVRH